MENQTKNLYNPFKMIGSWIGLIIGFSILFLFISVPALQKYEEMNAQYEIQIDCVSTSENQCVIMEKPQLIPLFFLDSTREKALHSFLGPFNFFPIIGYILLVIFYTLPILGFLIGWKIHSFIKKMFRPID